MHDWVASPEFDRLLVETVQATYPPHEHERFLAHFRGLVGMWVADSATSAPTRHNLGTWFARVQPPYDSPGQTRRVSLLGSTTTARRSLTELHELRLWASAGIRGCLVLPA